MTGRGRFRMWRTFPLVLLVTAAVAAVPLVAVWELRLSGVIASPWMALLVAVLLSVLVSWLLNEWWTRRRGPNDLLFTELLPWGCFSRWRSERILADGMRLLEEVRVGKPAVNLSRRRRTRLLKNLVAVMEAQDMYLAGHSRRVARHATMLGRRMGLTRKELARLRAAAAIHDVGKLQIPPDILSKPGRLTAEEFALIKRHSEDGAYIVASLGDPELTAIVRHHHERIDGKGYPYGLKGPQIPLGARIVAVADTFDAITSIRPYRGAASHHDAIREMRICAGTQLDPSAVKTFLRCYSGWRQVVLLAALVGLPQRILLRLRGSTRSYWRLPGQKLATLALSGVVAGLTLAPVAAGPSRISVAQARPEPVGLSDPLMGNPLSGSALSSGWGRTGKASFARYFVGASTRRHEASRAADRAGRSRGRHAPGARPARARTRDGVRIAAKHGARGHHRATSDHRARRRGRRGAGSKRTRSAAACSWTPPGRSGAPPPGRRPEGPPGQSGDNPGLSGAGPPGLRGEAPPGQCG